MTGRRAWMALGFGLLGSQAGHLLVYQVRFGAAAQQLQMSGAHAYFPGLVRASLGVTAALVLASMFLVGLARILSGRSIRPDSAPDFLRLVAMLYTVQLACFAGQEVGEALVAGTRVTSVSHLLLWGTLGQLPVAVLAAAGLRWLLVRFESAVAEIGFALAAVPKHASPIALVVSAWGQIERTLVLRPVAGASPAKRGPPSSVRVSTS